MEVRWLSMLVCGLIVFGFLSVVGPAGAADWPSWMGPEGRNVSGETGLPVSFDRKTKQNVKWVAPLGAHAFGCPTVAAGRVYVGTTIAAARDDKRFDALNSGGVLACLDAETGDRVWTLVSPVRTEGYPDNTFNDMQRFGICSSPTVDEDRVYVVTNGGDLLCLDVNGLADGNDGPYRDEGQFMAKAEHPPVVLLETDADILWRYDMPRELQVAPHDVGSSSVLVLGDVVYACTSNGIGVSRMDDAVNAANPDAPAFIAVDKRTGKLLAVDDTAISRTLFHAQWGSPSVGRVGERTLILVGGADGYCYAFEPYDDSGSGKLTTVWRYNCNPPHYTHKPDGSRIEYSWGDVRTYRRRQKVNAQIDAFNTDTTRGAIKRKLTVAEYNSNDGIFVGPSEVLASPVFYKDRVYVATGRDPLHGKGRGVLHCIDATSSGDITASGQVWRFEEIGRSLTSVAVADDLVYAADLEGQVYCLDADTGALQWQHDVGGEIWANPLVADGKVYLNTERGLRIYSAGREMNMLFEERGGGASGAIVANGVVYVFARGKLYAIEEGAAGRG
jgi:outer membrane protein assembly factor BamB